MEAQSVMITLLLGFLGMLFTELLVPLKKESNNKIGRKTVLVLTCAYILIGFTNYKMEANFNFV